MKVYVAGPMRGRHEFNFPAFERASVSLEIMGYEVFSPARRDLATGFDPTGLTGDEVLKELGFDLREALSADTRWICEDADAIYMLAGWERSSGATAEHALAKALGLTIMFEGEPIPLAPGHVREVPPRALDPESYIRDQFTEALPHRTGSTPVVPTLPDIIGITGRKRHGKNTAAEGLVPLGFEVIGFADDLKDAALQLNPRIENGWRLKTLVERYGWEHVKDHYPEARRILQRLGTDVVRTRDPEFWLKVFRQKLTPGRKVVVADVRFDNEAELVRSLGGVVVEVVRPDLSTNTDTHASEAGVDASLIDLVLLNSGTAEDMQRRLVRGLARFLANKENSK